MRKRFHAIAHWKAEPIKACVCAVSTPSERKACRDPGQPVVGPCLASINDGESAAAVRGAFSESAQRRNQPATLQHRLGLLPSTLLVE